ncbi:MAG: bifunctional metallophosphatase/5'-nucleotidase [Clostridiales bacterium]|nr:bifunctional metallophosphatase/5'-nucleotidase [Clostridiales bacterium]
MFVSRIKGKTAVIALIAALSVQCSSCALQDTGTDKNGDVYILYTSDVHCAVNQGFGFAGLMQIRDNLESQGYETILVDNGDMIQGNALGSLTEGGKMIELMNAMHYDIAVPGNHEFEYGADRFVKLTVNADFPYICCNFTKDGELVFEPYTIKETAGMKIAFVGVTTPTTIKTKQINFVDSNGENHYSLMADESGDELCQALQSSIDSARAEGADYVYVLGHIGREDDAPPWTYDEIISRISGVDVFIDGHSHDMNQVVIPDKDGNNVVRTACGCKLNGIGYSHISKDAGITDTNIWKWTNNICAAEVFGISNTISDKVNEAVAEVDTALGQPFAAAGHGLQAPSLYESNLGDLLADAFRSRTGADVAVLHNGSIKSGISSGNITRADILKIMPYSNEVKIVRVSGQQILDALEWGVHKSPEPCDAFLQVSGLTYSVDTSIPSSCTADDLGRFSGVSGARRVSDVRVGDQPIDPDRTYTLASIDFILVDNGFGQTAFNDYVPVENSFGVDNNVLTDYILEDLGGTVGDSYADPAGQGRIIVR